MKVIEYTRRGWLKNVTDEAMRPFWSRHDALSTDFDCLTWETQVVVPKSLREKVLALPHEGHPGVSRMKALAREYVWWPGMDFMIEQAVRCCEICQMTQNNTQLAPVHP